MTSAAHYPVLDVWWRRGVLAGAGVLAAAALVMLALDEAWVRAVLAFLVCVLILGPMLVGTESVDGARRNVPLPARTAKGTIAVEQAGTRAHRAGLNPKTRPESPPYDPEQAQLAVALFGDAALDRVNAHLLDDRRAPVSYVDGPGD